MKIRPRMPRPMSPSFGWIFAAMAMAVWSVLAGENELKLTGIRDVAIPPLRVNGSPARAHTQGMVWYGERWWITARLESVTPRHGILLRWSPGADHWETWNISPPRRESLPSAPLLDHAGGFQEFQGRLWIPVAESRAHGASVIRAFDLASLRSGEAAVPSREIPVEDHIGAVAVIPPNSARRDFPGAIVLGASWDTETVYGWTLEGKGLFRWNGLDLSVRGLGPPSREGAAPGLTVQDWKWFEGRLVASGLLARSAEVDGGSRGRLIFFHAPFDPAGKREVRAVPRVEGMEWAREAMTPDPQGNAIWFLPADLGATNRLIRVPLSSLSVVSPGH